MSEPPAWPPPPPRWLIESDPGACELLHGSHERALLNDVNASRFNLWFPNDNPQWHGVHCYMLDESHPEVRDALCERLAL